MNDSMNVLNDPQGELITIMRPVQGFEDIYQGKPIAKPIQLYPSIPNPLAFENERQRLGYDPLLSQFMRVPNGATLRLKFPLMQGLVSAFPDPPVRTVQRYYYQLRWRTRVRADNTNDPIRHYSSESIRGYDSGSNAQYALSVSAGRVFYPDFPANSNLNLAIYDEQENIVHDQQGVVDPEMAGAAGGDAATWGPTFYPPEQEPIVDDEVTVILYRLTGNSTWDFTAGTGDDWPLAYTLGRGRRPAAGVFEPSHPINPAQGVYLMPIVRATTP